MTGEVTIPPDAIVSADGKSFYLAGEQHPDVEPQPLGSEWQEVGYVEYGEES